DLTIERLGIEHLARFLDLENLRHINPSIEQRATACPTRARGQDPFARVVRCARDRRRSPASSPRTRDGLGPGRAESRAAPAPPSLPRSAALLVPDCSSARRAGRGTGASTPSTARLVPSR